MAYFFEWDPAKADANAGKHGVTFDEASTVLGDPPALLMLDPEHSVNEQRHLLLGMSSQQRLCVETFAERPLGTGLISARRATPQERRRWRGRRCDRDQAEHKVSIDEGVTVFGVRRRHKRH